MYEGDESCIDPLDDKHEPRKHYDELDGKQDVLIIYRDVVGDPDTDEGWPRWHLLGQGVFDNMRMKDFKKLAKRLGIA